MRGDIRGDQGHGAGSPALAVVVADGPVLEEVREGVGVVAEEVRFLEADDEALGFEGVEIGEDIVVASHPVLRGGILGQGIEVVCHHLDVGNEAKSTVTTAAAATTTTTTTITITTTTATTITITTTKTTTTITNAVTTANTGRGGRGGGLGEGAPPPVGVGVQGAAEGGRHG
jgi:hypothetical protein